jgi:hypothetical protein
MVTTRTKLALLLAAAVAGGCATGPDSPVAPARTLDRSPLFAAGGATQQVTGHANMLLPVFGGAEQKYSQSAIRHADGTFSGEFELRSEQTEPPIRIHGSVTCFTIVPTPEGGMARLAGIIEQSNFAGAPAGTYAIWTIIDTGEGANSPPDLTSDFFAPFPPAIAEAHCAVGFNLAPFIPVEGGNLQVHP